MTEIRNWDQGSSEQVVTYPHSSVRLINGQPGYMHSDKNGNVRTLSDTSGNRDKRSVYRPFGKPHDQIHDGSAATEDKGFVGQRHDDDSALIYLNARYYDPALGLFVTPDWLDVTTPGVGTNRYAYALHDPINGMDPSGNATVFSDRDGDGLNETATHFSPDSEIGRDLANVDWSSYGDTKMNGAISAMTLAMSQGRNMQRGTAAALAEKHGTVFRSR